MIHNSSGMQKLAIKIFEAVQIINVLVKYVWLKIKIGLYPSYYPILNVNWLGRRAWSNPIKVGKLNRKLMTNWQETRAASGDLLSHVTGNLTPDLLWTKESSKVTSMKCPVQLHLCSGWTQHNTTSPYILCLQVTVPWRRPRSRRRCPRCFTRALRWCPPPPPPRPPPSPRSPPCPPFPRWPQSPAWWRRLGPARLSTRSIAPLTKLTSSPPSPSRQSSETSKPTVSEIIDDLCRKNNIKGGFLL